MAATSNFHRKRAEVVLPAYTHISGQLCVYCGQSAETKDHVPAVSTAWAFGTDYFRSQGIPLLAYPSCQECNASCVDCAIEASNCIECAPGVTLTAGKCEAICNANQALINNSCIDCNAECLT